MESHTQAAQASSSSSSSSHHPQHGHYHSQHHHHQSPQQNQGQGHHPSPQQHPQNHHHHHHHSGSSSYWGPPAQPSFFPSGSASISPVIGGATGSVGVLSQNGGSGSTESHPSVGGGTPSATGVSAPNPGPAPAQQPSAVPYPLNEIPSTAGFPAASADPAAYARAGAFNGGTNGVDAFYPLGLPSVMKRPTNPNAPPRQFKCNVCAASFSRNHDLKRHLRIHLAVKPFPCQFCEKSFSRKDALKRHVLVKGCGQGNKKEKEERAKKGKGKAAQQVPVGSDRSNEAIPNGSVTGVSTASTASPGNNGTSIPSTNPYDQAVHPSDFGLAGGAGSGGASGTGPADHNGSGDHFYPRGGASSLVLGSPYGSADVGREGNGGFSAYPVHGPPSAYGGGPSARTGLPMSVSSSAGSSWYNQYGPGGNPASGGGGGGEGSGGSGGSVIRSRDSTYDTDSYASSMGHASAHTPRADTPHSLHQHPSHAHHRHGHQHPHGHPHHPHHGPHSHMGGGGGGGAGQPHPSPHSSHDPYSPQTPGTYSGYGAFYPGGPAGHTLGAMSNTVASGGPANGFDGGASRPYPQQQPPHYASPYSNADSSGNGGGGGHDNSGGGAAPPQPAVPTWWRQ
ncbi:unnamed protein product [Tilletia caries]|nr:unnamed protein product [Tilletia caries]